MTSSVLTIKNEFISVDISPTQGADIRKISRKDKAENLLLETKWKGSQRLYCDCSRIDEDHFLSHYAGGWQLMIPNAGFPSESEFGRLGYHGEAWSSAWKVIKHETAKMYLEVYLKTAPIKIQRKVEIRDQTLEISDLVTNCSNGEIKFLWGHHPAFSNLLIDESTEVCVNARSISSKINTTSPNFSDLPPYLVQNSESFYLKNFVSEPHSFLGFATNFKEGSAYIHNKNNNLLVNLFWDIEIFPHAWLWIENKKISREPWSKKVTTLAIEPSSTKTNLGLEDSLKFDGSFTSLKAKESVGAAIYLEVLTLISKSEDVMMEKSRKD
jgi:hypothetical protein